MFVIPTKPPSLRETRASFEKAAKKIELALLHVKRTTPHGLRLIGEEIMTDVKASAPGHGVPVDTGALRASGVVEQPEPFVVELSFGSAAVQYALLQHEGLEYHHTIGEARYLVRGLERWRSGGSAAMNALQEMTREAIRQAARA
jgi:hypothetical protein